MTRGRRSSLLALALTAAAAPVDAQWTAGGDLTMTTRYQWRGLTRHDGVVWQPQLYATRRFDGWRLSAGTWTVIQSAGNEPPFGVGLGDNWFGEVSPWLEAGAALGGLEVSGGWTGYFYQAGAQLTPSPRSTSEVYARVTTLELPVVVPRATLWYDVGDYNGAYLETALSVRVPLWAAVKIPVGSLVLGGTLGWNLGQTADPDPSGDVGHFAERGLTHADLSAGIATGVIPAGPFDSWLRLEFHYQRNEDPLTRIAGQSEPRRHLTWFALSTSLLAPRCRPQRAICP
jgi:hypothetical protein